MNNIPTKMNIYKYVIDSFKIILSTEIDPINIDKNHITSIYIEKDYENDHFPILKVNISLDTELYYKILDDKLNVKFHLRLQKIIKTDNNEYNFKNDVINDVFCPFIDDDTPFLNKDMYEKTKETENANVSMSNKFNEYTFYLFKETDLNNSKKIINNIITEANLTDTITYCLYSSNIKNVLMSPLINKKIYKEILLLPISTLMNLLYLEQQYDGFYNNPALVYFDIDNIYIIDSGLESKAFRKQEPEQTVFTVHHSTNPDSFSSGSLELKDEKKYVININHNSITMNSRSIISDQIDGNNFIVINPNTGENSTIKSKATQRGEGTYKVLINKFNNKRINDYLIKRKKEESNILNTIISNIDIDSITPNKEFLFIFEDQNINKKHGGKYKLIKNICFFVKEGEEFDISLNCDFKKIK